MKFLKNITRGDASTRNKGAISLEYILVIVVVVLACLVGMKAFGGRIGETINNSKDAVVNVANPIIADAQGSGSGAGGSGGGGSEPVVTANYYKNNTNGNIITKADYDGWPEEWQNMYSEHYGDVYEYTWDGDPRLILLSETQVNPWYKVEMSDTQGGTIVKNVAWSKTNSKYTVDQEVTDFGPTFYVTSVTEFTLTETKVQ